MKFGIKLVKRVRRMVNAYAYIRHLQENYLCTFWRIGELWVADVPACTDFRIRKIR